MTNPATTQQDNPDPTSDEESQRIANAFDEKMKTAKPAEVSENGEIVQKLEPVKVEAKTAAAPEGLEDEFPPHVIDGVKPEVTAPKDEELEAITPPAKMSQAGTSSFVQLRVLAEKRGAELQRLTKELEAAKSAAPTVDLQSNEQLKALQERATVLELELERAAFERSPKYRELVGEAQASISAAKSYLEGGDVDTSVIDRAASLTGAKRLAALKESGLDSETISAVAASLVDHDRTIARGHKMLESHKTVQSEWAQQESAKAEANEKRLQAEEEKVFNQVGIKVQESFPTFQKVQGNDKWNTQVDQLNAEAKEFFQGKLPLDRMAEIAYAGVAYRVEHRRANILGERLKAALAENQKLKAVQPSAGDSNGQRAATNGNAALDGSPNAVAARFDASLGRA